MDSDRFDAIARTLARRPSRRRMLGALLAALAGTRSGSVGAEDNAAIAGNGGRANAHANGGALRVGNINSGGNTIAAGDTVGDVQVYGGRVVNTTSVDLAADDGTAIADASGGDHNLAAVIEPGPEAEEPDEPEPGYADYPYPDYDDEIVTESDEDISPEGEIAPDPDNGPGTVPELEPEPEPEPEPEEPEEPEPEPGPDCPCEKGHSYCPSTNSNENRCCPNQCGRVPDGSVCCGCGP
ncbi:MAG: hypothetical protein M3Z20_13360, partial [Chloroflexota bacterium]|nr:hypothetical protein [Chloroflexota bacterium]